MVLSKELKIKDVLALLVAATTCGGTHYEKTRFSLLRAQKILATMRKLRKFET